MVTANQHILIVDDDIEIQKLLSRLLQRNGFLVTAVSTGTEMQSTLSQETISLILLDVMMEHDNGLSLCKTMRAKSSIPIIIISALGKPSDRVLGLELGADDYISKPFYPQEIIARIESVLRRHKQINVINKANRALQFSGWTLYPEQHRLFSPENVEVSLSAGEYVLLEVFVKNPMRVLSREQLLDYLHQQYQSEVFDRSIDVQISRLRKRIETNPHTPELIKTVRGKGYQLYSEVVTDEN